ncbi:MAG: efflux RND transporter permease subunit [Symbiobacteriaceae bacterium]|nr:efflux RND transporter permease subunit [Symbiobacteriaceae bacterium]
MSEFAIRRPVTVVMLFLITVIMGFMALVDLKQALLPEVNVNIAVVRAEFSGAGPDEVESMVIKLLESALGTVSGLSEMTTTASNGNALLMLVFEDGVNMDSAALLIRERVDLVRQFLPSGVEPMVLAVNPNMLDNLTIGITGNMDLVDLKTLIDNNISNRLEKLDGVASVSDRGGKEREIAINLKPDRMNSYGVSATQVAQLIAAENRNVPGGDLIQGDMQLQVRTQGEFASIKEIEDLLIPNARGMVLTIKDIAEVVSGYKEQSSYTIINGIPGMTLTVQKQSTANTVEVSDRVNAELVLLRRDFPELQFTVANDSARFIKTSINNVWNAALQATLLAVIILFIFLGEWRSSLIIAVSIPSSILATLALMFFFGFTINMVTLMSLVISVGMLVDNSIVVLENIMRHMEMGKDKVTAALDGSKEIIISIMGSTLTTVVVFVPILFTTGIAGEMLQQLGFVITMALGVSLLVSLTFVPMACSQLLRVEYSVTASTRGSAWQSWNAQLLRLHNGYHHLLLWALNHKRIVITITLGFVTVTGLLLGTMGMNMIPNMDMSMVTIDITLPRGSLLTETGSVAEEILQRVRSHPAVADALLTVGGGGAMNAAAGSASHRASILANLHPKQSRAPIHQITEELKQRISLFPDVELTISSQGGVVGGGAAWLGMGSSLSLNLYGEDMELLRSHAERIIDIISVLPAVANPQSSLKEGAMQANIRVDRVKAAYYGLQPASVAATVQMAVTGFTVTKYKEDGNDIDVVIRYNPEDLLYLEDLQNIVLSTATGGRVALHEIATIEMGQDRGDITKINSRRYVTISAEIIGSDLNTVSQEVSSLLANYVMEDSYSWELGSTYTTMMDSFTDLGIALALGFIMVYMVVASQFESLIYPFIIIFSIPVSMTAGLFGLFVTAQSINLLAIIGLILLMGVVVNNGIVLVDFIHILRQEGKSTREAILEAGPVRLRPILMTTITTVVGLLPLLLATGEGSELQAPMGAIIAYGLSFATLITLILIPTLYEMIYDFREGVRQKRVHTTKEDKVEAFI